MKIHSGEKPHQCEYCGKAFMLKSDLTKHYWKQTWERPYQCIHCYKIFTQKGNHDVHMMTHTVGRPYQRSHHDQAFSGKSDPTINMEIHSENKYCGLSKEQNLRVQIPSNLLSIKQEDVVVNEENIINTLDMMKQKF